MEKQEYDIEKRELELLKKLIRIKSVNSLGGGDITNRILDYLEERKAKFSHRILKFGNIKNLVLFAGEGEEAIVLNGHYDVVPASRKAWGTDPFDAHEEGGFVYGRGTCDMKGSLVSLVSAFADYACQPTEKQKGKVILMIVGDEEKGGKNGTIRVLESIIDDGIKVKKALVGEPNANEKFGDRIKNGRRGILWLKLSVKGRAGHGSRPREAKNPILTAVKIMNELRSLAFETAGAETEPTTVSPTFLNSDGKATNVIPEEAILKLDIRYNHPKFPEKAERLIEHISKENECKVEIEREEYSLPFTNGDKNYEKELADLSKRMFGKQPIFEMKGGSSDAKYFVQYEVPVLEMGPAVHNVHGNNEKVSIEDLSRMRRFVSRFIGVGR